MRSSECLRVALKWLYWLDVKRQQLTNASGGLGLVVLYPQWWILTKMESAFVHISFVALVLKSPQIGASLSLYIEATQPEWCISSMTYSGDTPFWSETLDMFSLLRKERKKLRERERERKNSLFMRVLESNGTLLTLFWRSTFQLSYIPWIKYFGLPISVTWPVYTNINNRVFPWCWSQSDLHLYCKFGMTCTWTKKIEKRSCHDRDFPVIDRNELSSSPHTLQGLHYST